MRPAAAALPSGVTPAMAPGTRADRERNEEKWWNEQPAAFREECESSAAEQAARKADHTGIEAVFAAGDEKTLLTMFAETEEGEATDPDQIRASARRAAWEEAHPDEPRYDDRPD